MANNFDEKSITISNANLTDVFTASNKTVMYSGTIANKSGVAINVSLKKLDASASTTTNIIGLNTPLPSGSAIPLPKVGLAASDKIQIQSDNASGNCDININLLTDVA